MVLQMGAVPLTEQNFNRAAGGQGVTAPRCGDGNAQPVGFGGNPAQPTGQPRQTSGAPIVTFNNN